MKSEGEDLASQTTSLEINLRGEDRLKGEIGTPEYSLVLLGFLMTFLFWGGLSYFPSPRKIRGPPSYLPHWGVVGLNSQLVIKCFEIHRWICGIYRNSDSS